MNVKLTGLKRFDCKRLSGVCQTASLKFNQAFTLVELMAVIAIVMLLAAITVGLNSYFQKHTYIQLTRAQIAAMTTALEAYKDDFGYYPPTTPIHFSNLGGAESTNNGILYRALCGQGKIYLERFAAGQVHTNVSTGLMNIFDVFGTPFNYYNSPTTQFGLSNNFYVAYGTTNNYLTGYAVGGQVNPQSYDLMSYGPDGVTYVSSNCAVGYWNDGPWIFSGVRAKSSTTDDITSWGR